MLASAVEVVSAVPALRDTEREKLARFSPAEAKEGNCGWQAHAVQPHPRKPGQHAVFVRAFTTPGR